MTDLHAYGYEGKVEEVVAVEEFYRARCTAPGCDWTSDEFDGMAWKDAEAAAIEHYESEHDDEDEEDGES